MKWIFFTRIFIALLCIVFIVAITFSILSSVAENEFVYLIGISVSIALSLIIAAIVSLSITHEIREINNSARRLASGDFSVRATIRLGSRLREFVESFNLMVERMETIFNELSAKKEELDSVLSSIQEGVLVINYKGRIILCNEGFKKTFNTASPEKRFYWEIVRDPTFGEIVEKVMKEKGNFVEEIAIGDKSFLCGANFLSYREEIVLTFYDITEIRNLEKIKRDFVANLSHELRTPLTSIKGFAESLEDEVTEDGEHYLDIIKRNTDRLVNIVKDLLLLSELETQDEAPMIEEVNLKNLINDVLSIFEQKAKTKNLDLKFNAEQEISIIKGDPFKLEQMLINLLENAIKYTEKGEISIYLKQDDEKVIIEIQDTGIGIPESHLARIFERFYVVDKSRSRKLGGTGLGLSIVKHIVLLHNGKIDVDSNYGAGTKFTLTLPNNLS